MHNIFCIVYVRYSINLIYLLIYFVLSIHEFVKCKFDDFLKRNVKIARSRIAITRVACIPRRRAWFYHCKRYILFICILRLIWKSIIWESGRNSFYSGWKRHFGLEVIVFLVNWNLQLDFKWTKMKFFLFVMHSKSNYGQNWFTL